MRTGTILIILLAGLILLACSQSHCRSQDDGETFQESDPVQSPDDGGSIPDGNQPEPYSDESGSAHLPYFGELSLKERIANYPTIVKATLDSVTSEVAPAGGAWTGKYVIVVKFHLTVSEYLSGSGATNIIAIWGSTDSYDSRSAAEAARPGLVAQRDTSYDDREAIIFITSEFWELFGALKADNTYFMGYADDFDDDFISITSRYNKIWLPVVDGATGTGDSEEFLLAAPEPATAQQQAGGVAVRNATSTRPMIAYAQATPPTITLGELKTKIVAVNAELNSGDGSDAFKECIKARYYSERVDSHRESEGRKARLRQVTNSHVTVSGRPAGTVLYTVNRLGTYPDRKDFETWLDQRDAPLFEMVYSPMTPVDQNYDGKFEAGVDTARYTESLQNTRPLPDGRYTFNVNDLSDIAVPCNDVDTYEWAVTAYAPNGVLHELFFDPVSVGSGVAADATNGVLKPASFTGANGESATLSSISYESGTVMIGVSPDDALAGHSIDFVELDGSVSLSLDVADAAVDAANDTLSWSVDSQPWDDGDLLMVRIYKVTAATCADPSAPFGACDPVFSSPSYVFAVSEDAVIGHVVGSVSATSPKPGVTVSYSITAGNGDGKFSTDQSTGEIMVAGVIDPLTPSLTTLTVQATDLAGNSSEATVEIYIARTPTGFTVVADGNFGFAISWNAMPHANLYEFRYRSPDGTKSGSQTSGLTQATITGLPCDSSSEFRVRAQVKGVWSPYVVIEASCNVPPAFDESSYLFTVDEDAATGAVVGSVSATDEEGESLTYSIIEGNDDGHFAMTATAAGADITVAGTLDYETTVVYTLTVEARDGTNGAGTVAVQISVEDVYEDDPRCLNGVTVPDPSSNADLVRDCTHLLQGKDTLAGTGTLNWNNDIAITDWDGVHLTNDEDAVALLLLEDAGLTGSIPAGLSKLSSLTRLELDDNQLTGSIPVSLGGLTNLRMLYLDNNRLIGPIPPELGTLSRLEILSLGANQLTGEIPSDLSQLASLTQLILVDSQLTGAIPVELGNLSNLTDLWLRENRLTGTIPVELGALTNLKHLVLGDNALTGSIPIALGSLTNLRIFYLNDNGLTGSIPSELGNLTNLTDIRLGGNRLTGCIPEELEDVRLNDLAKLNLPYCDDTPPAPDGLSVSLSGDTFSIGWTAVEGADEYQVQYRTGDETDWTDLDTATTDTSQQFSPAGGPTCGTTYEFQVLAHGDGVTLVAEWSEPSDVASVTTAECQEAPEFDSATYDFSVAEDAGTGVLIGVVSATDPNAVDTVAYSIETGNTDGTFAIDSGSGEIMVAAALDYETAQSYTLTVQASDGNGGTASTTVTITVTDVNEPPAFEAEAYAFSVAEGIGTGASVGTVSATDPDGGATLTYSIAAGNDDGKFAINSGSGEITVAGTLDYEIVSSYTLAVEASDGSGGTASAQVTISVTDITEPPAPQNLTADATHDSVTLKWDASTDSTVTGYQILRRATNTQNTLQIHVEDTGNTATTYVDADVEADTSYTYSVRAINDIGVGSLSVHATVTTDALVVSSPTSAPNAPENLSAVATHDTVALTWDAPSGPSVTGYRILRRARDAGSFETIESDSGNTATAYVDTDVEPETRYIYRVVAINGVGASSPSQPARVTTGMAP